MELTLDQALQKGIEAHRAGQIQEADRYYTAILKANPSHPDANHNIGVLAVGLGKVEEALPFFNTAIETKPSTAQYWLSYIDALIKLDRMTDAEVVLDQAKSKGQKGDGFDRLRQRMEEAKSRGVLDAKSQQPPEEKLQFLIKLYTQGQYQEALDECSKLLRQFTRSIRLYNICGAANASLGKLDAAMDNYKKAISIKPDYVDAHNNLGQAHMKATNFEQAEICFKEALRINPNQNKLLLSLALQGLGRYEDAIDAIALKVNKPTEFKNSLAEEV